ncbi:MAG: tRNA-dihydrouridine synthase, partial [Aeromonas sp.]
RVYRVKQDYPELTIALNGGVTSMEQTLAHLQQVDGVMMGREAYQNPYILAQVDNLLFAQHNAVPSRHEVVRMMLPYIEQELAKGNYLSHVTRHMLGLFQNMPGARAWRRHLSENACKPGADIAVVLAAMAKVPELATTESELIITG